MLIFIDWQNLKDTGMIPGKFFEYMHRNAHLKHQLSPNSFAQQIDRKLPV